MSDKIRKVLSNMNIRRISEATGISYNVLRNFYYGQKQHLSPIEENLVIKAIKELTTL